MPPIYTLSFPFIGCLNHIRTAELPADPFPLLLEENMLPNIQNYNSAFFQVHDEVILEGPTESAEVAKAIVVECMSKPFYGQNFLKVGLAVDAKCAQNWYAAK